MNDFDIELIKKYLPQEKWEVSIQRLKDGYPVQYIIGNVDFYGCLINVNQNVLIPRFETEYLVDDLIKLMKKHHFINPQILDIGTGSGCISIALKKNIEANIKAIDISEKAILVAKENANINNVMVDFEKISIEDYNSQIKYDVIVSNPPYIAPGEYVQDKTKYEPSIALYANDNGLYFYNLIINKSKTLLKKRNMLAFEIGSTQADAIKRITKKVYPNSNIIVKKDLNQLDRYIFIINE